MPRAGVPLQARSYYANVSPSTREGEKALVYESKGLGLQEAQTLDV